MSRTYVERKARFLEVIDRPLNALGRFTLIGLIILYYLGAWRLLVIIFPILGEDIMNYTRIALTVFSPIGVLVLLALLNIGIYTVRWLLTGRSNRMLFAKILHEYDEGSSNMHTLLACVYAFYLLFGKRSKKESIEIKDRDLCTADAEIEKLLSYDPLVEKIDNL